MANIRFENQEDFIDFAINFYREKTYGWWDELPRPNVINWLYKLGRDYQVLNLDRAQFEIILKEYRNYNCDGTRRVRSYKFYWWIRRYDPDWHRRPVKFTYNGQKKKDRPTKNDWWEHKGIAKDRRKMYRRTGWKKCFKQSCHKKHRQLERESISSGRYDRLHRLSYKHADDIWNWD